MKHPFHKRQFSFSFFKPTVLLFISLAIGCGSSKENSLTSIVFDRFDRPDSAATLGKSETGQLWVSGPWGISTNQASTTAATAGIATIQTYQPEVMIRVGMPITAAKCGVVLRASDINNFWFFYNDTSLYRLAKVQAGVAHDVLDFSNLIPTDGDVVTIQTSKTHIIASVNGSLRTTSPTAFEDFNVQATMHGFGCTTGSTTVRFDNLTIQTGDHIDGSQY